MNAENLFNLAGAIVTLAVVTVVITSPQTVGIIRASGGAFTGAIKAATLR